METHGTVKKEKRTGRYTSFKEFCDYYYRSNQEQETDEKKGEASFGTKLAKEVFRKAG